MTDTSKDFIKFLREKNNEFINLSWLLQYYTEFQDSLKEGQTLPLGSVSARLSSSLGECVEGNDYEIVADKDGRFWINHKEVGSGEPLEQWIDGVLNVR